MGRAVQAGLLGATVLLGAAAPSTAAPIFAPPADAPSRAQAGRVVEDLRLRGWVWPFTAVRVVRPYLAPPHDYGAGHRGIDIAGEVGAPVRAPAAGIVAFVGDIAGRGILTIDHGGGLVTTFEPVDSGLAVGAAVSRAEAVATLALGGHAEPASLHFGVRRDGAYINPMLLLHGVPRAVLLPCC